jgi:hypothetical protein
MHLLDINVRLAMAFRRHVSHVAAAAWFQAAPGQCLFCRLTQMGFLRLASNPSAMGPAAVSMADAWRAYDTLVSDPKVAFLDELAFSDTGHNIHTESVERCLPGCVCRTGGARSRDLRQRVRQVHKCTLPYLALVPIQPLIKAVEAEIVQRNLQCPECPVAYPFKG